MTRKLITLAFLVCATCVRGQTVPIPKGYIIPKSTLSPDGRYGVLVPVLAQLDLQDASDENSNRVVDTTDGRVLATIDGDTGYDEAFGFSEMKPPRWSPDGSLLLWEIAGKWSPTSLVLLHIERGMVDRQIDLIRPAQRAILARTKKAAPRRYLAAKKANAGNGSAFPEGLTVDVKVIGPITLPLHIQANLTASPKDIPWFPKLDSRLEGTIDAGGKFRATSFQLGHGRAREFYDGNGP